MPNHKDSEGKGGHPAKEPYRASLQSIAHAIKELRDTVDASKRAEQTEKSQNKAKESTLAKFFQAWLPIILNALLLVVVLGQAIYAYLQWQEMKRTQRAWVVVHDTGFAYAKRTDGTPTAGVFIALVNTGPSPAFGSHIRYCIEAREHEPDVSVLPNENCVAHELGVLGNAVPVKFNLVDLTQTIPENSLIADMSPGKHLYTWGQVTYRIFTGDKDHHTWFCLLNSGKSLAPCPHGNNGD